MKKISGVFQSNFQGALGITMKNSPFSGLQALQFKAPRMATAIQQIFKIG